MSPVQVGFFRRAFLGPHCPSSRLDSLFGGGRTLRNGMTETVSPRSDRTPKQCQRVGCFGIVKKPTGKYCSVRCCSIDPVRQEKLRQQARASSRRSVLPLAHQLALTLGEDPEAEIGWIAKNREDVPAGMSRLAG